MEPTLEEGHIFVPIIRTFFSEMNIKINFSVEMKVIPQIDSQINLVWVHL